MSEKAFPQPEIPNDTLEEIKRLHSRPLTDLDEQRAAGSLAFFCNGVLAISKSVVFGVRITTGHDLRATRALGLHLEIIRPEELGEVLNTVGITRESIVSCVRDIVLEKGALELPEGFSVVRGFVVRTSLGKVA